MSEHTQGPWEVLDGSPGMVYTIGSPYGHGPMHVADARGWGHLTGRGACAMSDVDAGPIQDANARLIAAAPDLFDALLHMRHRNHDVSLGCDPCVKAVALLARFGR